MRALAALGAALACVTATAGASDSGYPSRPVKVIVPLGAGSGSDVATRIIMDRLSKALGQSFFIDNRPGAQGNLGVAAGAKAAPDGYTLVTGGLGITVLNQFLTPPWQMGYDPVKDLEPIVLLAKAPMLIVANPSFAPNGIAGLIAAANAKPGTLNVAYANTTARLLYELFVRTAGISMVGVPYKTSGTAASDTVGGITPLNVDTLAALRPYVVNGRLKPIAVSTPRTSPLMPNVPSVAEQGLPGFEVTGYVSLYGPRGMPAEAVRTINLAVNKILELPGVRKSLDDLGLELGGGSPELLAELERAQREKWGALIKAANIKVD